MNKKYVLWFLILSLLMIFPVFSIGQQALPDNYGPEEAAKLAKILDKQIIFVFIHPECGYCTLYKEKTLSSPEIIDLIEEHFVLSLINIDQEFKVNLPGIKEMTNRQLASAVGMQGTPHTAFFYPPNPDLRAITALSGYRQINFMKKVLNFIGREIYNEEIEFKDYGVNDVDKKFYNYQNRIKEITPQELTGLKKIGVPLKIIKEPLPLDSLKETGEVILNFADKDTQKEFAQRLISKGVVKKVFSVD